jgi:hypothetical protein
MSRMHVLLHACSSCRKRWDVRDYFFYYSGATPSAVRYKNWKMYYTMSQPGAEGWLLPLTSFHFTLVQNIKRDPFEQSVGSGPHGHWPRQGPALFLDRAGAEGRIVT